MVTLKVATIPLFACSVIRPIPVFFCRMMFLAGGFHWITERGVRASSAEAPILVCGPHSSFYDALIVAYLGLTTVVVKSGTENIPLVGSKRLRKLKLTPVKPPIYRFFVHRNFTILSAVS